MPGNEHLTDATGATAGIDPQYGSRRLARPGRRAVTGRNF